MVKFEKKKRRNKTPKGLSWAVCVLWKKKREGRWMNFFFFFHLAGLLSIHDRPLFFLFLFLLLLSSLLLFLLFFTRRPPVINRNLFFFPLFFWSLSSHRTPPTSQPCGSPCVKIRDERIPSSRFLLLFYCVCVCVCVFAQQIADRRSNPLCAAPRWCHSSCTWRNSV